MKVYYVTAMHHGPARSELAKFFTRPAAEAHARQLDVSWKLVRVEEREETLDDQHHAHGGKVGAPAR